MKKQDQPTPSQAFIESDKRYGQLLENASDVVFTLDARGRITLLNKAFSRITGWQTDEWIGRHYPPIIHEADLPLAMEKFQQALRGISGDLFELRVRNKSGGYITAEFIIARHQEDGAPASVFGIARDITERKRLETHLHHSQKMESLGSLAGGIAHDFNNLIGIITGYCELASDSLENDHPAQSYLAQIDTAGQRAASLVQQILTFARKKKVSLKPLQLNDAIEDIARMLQETLPRTIEIQQDLDKSLPQIQGDSSQINQILMNLCLNARDAMNSEGTLTLSTRTLSGRQLPPLLSNPKTPYVQVSVTDTGSGMSEEIMQSIFEPFFTTKDKGRGSGLGLAVVHGIVTSHQGHIEVESKPGKGTRFDLYFPARETTPVEVHRPAAEKDCIDGNGETILVVEDEPNIRQMTTLSLRRRGYQVINASDGVEALSVFEKNKGDIALILLDLGLPKLDGAKVAERIKESTPNMKIILASGYLEKDQQEAIKLTAVDDFLQKPYELKDMLRRVQTLIKATADSPHVEKP